MKYLSVCSGIEAATVAWHPLGWKPEAFSEIEKFPSQVLKHHYPDVCNIGDMTKFEEWNLGTIDLLVGGTPCQSFSVAGLRKGLDDPRGNLMLTYGAIANRFRPRWLVWENVPGVLSSNGGRDFGSFLGMLGELGYGWAYRVLDAQYFGVAQRRRRVFVVGYLGNWRRAAAVLFERHSLQGNPAPSREKRKRITTFFESSLAQYRADNVGGTLKASGGVLGGESETFVAHSVEANPIESNKIFALAENTIGRQPLNGGNGDGFTEGGPMYTLNATGIHGVAHQIAPCYPISTQNALGRVNGKVDWPLGLGEDGDPAPTLTKAHGHAVAYSSPVAFAQNTRDEVRLINGDGSIVGALAAEPGMKQTSYVAQPIGFNARQDPCSSEDLIGAIDTDRGTQAVMQSMAVRRLTPVECERLQGFPDNYTNIPKAADGPRYKALGNSMAVPVMAWIGRRIQQVDAIQSNKTAECRVDA